MVVPAIPANNRPVPATPLVAMRAGSPVRAGSYAEDADDLQTPWHVHDQHQLVYAFEGVAEVECADSHHLLPPQQAAWIPAGLAHQTTIRRVRSGSVFFERDMVPEAGDRVRVLAAVPPIREMIVYAMRWPIDRAASDATADAFFDALARLCAEWLDSVETPLRLPTSPVPVVQAVMRYTQEHLTDVRVEEVCAAVGLSERSLRRQFRAATAMTWQQYRRTARVLRAMAILAESRRTVLDVATEVGFESLSAFNRAFLGLTGETPTAYRRRITAAAGPAPSPPASPGSSRPTAPRARS